jgi:hypothetical protein
MTYTGTFAPAVTLTVSEDGRVLDVDLDWSDSHCHTSADGREIDLFDQSDHPAHALVCAPLDDDTVRDAVTDAFNALVKGEAVAFRTSA